MIPGGGDLYRCKTTGDQKLHKLPHAIKGCCERICSLAEYLGVQNPSVKEFPIRERPEWQLPVDWLGPWMQDTRCR
jgi:hypothetical protein